MPRVSVILNSYNQGRYLGEAIESVLAQTFADFELLLIDNGSSDDSQELARAYAKKDARIKLTLHGENRSLSSRQNEGVRAASGELVAFLYSDDLYLPHKLERQVALFDRLGDDIGVVYAPPIGFNVLTGARWQHTALGESGYILPSLLRNFNTGHPDMLSPMSRRTLLLRYPFYDELFAEGESVYLRLAMTAKFHFDPEPVVMLREHDRNIGKAIRPNHENFLGVLAHVERHPDFPSSELRALGDLRARIIRDAGWAALRMGSSDVAWVRGRFAAAVRERWRHAVHPRVLIGLGLTLLPSPLRQKVNALGLRLRGHKANAIIRDDYV
jgi:glycosyltransferase involved in cell wall biosynthesis